MFQIQKITFFLLFGAISVESAFNGSYFAEKKPLPGPSEPQQIHLSLGRSHAEMVVTWTTYNASSSTQVRFGEDWDILNVTEGGWVTPFIDNGNRTHYIHRVMLKKLKPNTKYYYQCGSTSSWSGTSTFYTLSDDPNQTNLRLLVYGDLGTNNSRTVPYIFDEVNTEAVNGIFHNGDFAYDFDNDLSHNGDDFMRLMEPIVSRVPYQTSPGNHETGTQEGLDNYLSRFSMYDMTSPSADYKKKSDHYYAFTWGPALIISLNNEVYLNFDTLSPELKVEQELWLNGLLKEANKPDNRARHPWIIVFGHQPMYCTSCPFEECCKAEAKAIQDNMEEILYKNGVDLAIWSHIHDYERQLPLYKGRVRVSDIEEPYKNPKAPVHVITGSAGCREFIDFQYFPRPAWNAFGNSQYGYGIIEIVNRTNLIFSQKALINGVTPGNEKLHIIDRIEITQEHHGPW